MPDNSIFHRFSSLPALVVRLSRRDRITLLLSVTLILLFMGWGMWRQMMVPPAVAPTPKTMSVPVVNDSSRVMQKLSDIEGQLSRHSAYLNVDSLRAAIGELKDELNSRAGQTDASLSAQLARSTDSINARMNVIQQQLTALKARRIHHRVLTSAALPFTVMSIDTVQDAVMMTVSAHHRLFPLSVGDSLSGWTLTAADSAGQTATFRQADGATVTVRLNQQQTQGG